MYEEEVKYNVAKEGGRAYNISMPVECSILLADRQSSAEILSYLDTKKTFET